MKTRVNYCMFAGIGAIVASLLFPEASRAASVNTYTVNGVKWNLAADRYEGSQYIANPPANWSVYFADTHTGAPVYYCNMTLTGFSFTGSDSSRDITIPGVIDWNSGGSWGVEHGPLQFIASGAFSGKNITSVTIPSSILGINTPCFRNCGSLASIEVDESNRTYCSEDGALYNKKKTTLVKYPEGKEANYYEVPASVASLKAECLAGLKKLVAVRFLGGKPTCGSDVFEGSSFVGYCPESWGLTWGKEWNGIRMYPIPEGGIRVEDGVTNCYEIIDGVLWRAQLQDGAATEIEAAVAVGTVTIPDALRGNPVVGIKEWAFADCTNLTSVTIPNSVTNIGGRAFQRCSSLTSVSIGDGVASIGIWAFEYCHGLTSISVSSGNAHYSSGNGMLLTKDGSTLLQGVNGDVTIPGSVTSIGENAFKASSGLTSVTIPNSVTSIGYRAFYECSGLTNVTIPGGVTSIAERAFYNCYRLTNVTISVGVTNIGVEAFGACWQLKTICVSPENALYSSVNGLLLTKDGRTLLCGVNGDVTIPDGVTRIGENAFRAYHGLTSVTIPDSVAIVGEHAFAGCSRLTSVTIPDSVTIIGEDAFASCSCLTSVTIPNSVTNIGGGAFYYCLGLKELRVPKAWEGTSMLNDVWGYPGKPEGCEIIYYEPADSGEAVAVPEEWMDTHAAAILAGNGWDYAAAAKAEAANGMAVWECYLAGLSPTDAAAEFKVKSIVFEDGQAVVKWEPDLNEDGTKEERLYEVEGAEMLGGAWGPTNAASRFFRVRVGMP